jgi:hypothetical protein
MTDKGTSLYNSGKMFEKRNQFNTMEKYYIEAAKKYQNIEAMIDLANYYKEKNEIAKMTQYADMAISHNSHLAFMFYANHYGNLGDYPKQEEYLHLSIKYGNVNAMYILADIYISRLMFTNIDQYLDHLSISENIHATIELAKKYKISNNFIKWEFYCLRAIDQQNFSFVFDLAMYYESNQNFEEMEKMLLLLIEKKLENTQILEKLKSYYEKSNQNEKLINACLLSMKYDSQNVQYILDTAKIYEKISDFTNAELYYDLAINKGSLDAIIDFAIYHKNRGNHKAMQRYLRIGIENKNPIAHFLLGIQHKREKKFLEMEINFTESARLGNIDAICELIDFFVNDKKFKSAEYWYNKLIAESNQDNISYANLFKISKFLEEEEKYEEVIEIYKKINNPDSIYRIGCIYCDIYGNLNLAKQYFSQGISNNHLDSIFRFGYICEMQKLFSLMEEHYILAIDLGNSIPKISANLSHNDALYRYSLYLLVIKKDYLNAKKYAEMCIEKYNNIGCIEIAGDSCYKLGDHENMEKYYLQIISTTHNNESVNMKLGTFYEIIKKDFDLAIVYYKMCNNNFSKILSLCETRNIESECGICSEENAKMIVLKTCCSQHLCLRCIREILNEKHCFKCPFCREMVKFDSVYIIDRYGVKYGESIDEIRQQEQEQEPEQEQEQYSNSDDDWD